MSRKARAKFDSSIDPLQLAQQLLKVTKPEDYPRMITAFEEKKLQDFWLAEIQKLKQTAIRKN